MQGSYISLSPLPLSLSDHMRSRINQSESQFKTGTFDFHYVEYSHNWNSLIFVRIISAQYVS